MKRKQEIPDENAGVEAEENGEELSRFEEDAPGSLEKLPLAGDEDASEGEASQTAGNGRPDGAPPSRTRSGTVLLIGSVLLCLFLAAAGFFFIRFKAHRALFARGAQGLVPVTSIMRPVPLPDYREMLDFLLVYKVQGREMITAIRMEAGFRSSTRYRSFKQRNVVFRDTVYGFLLTQNAAGNSEKSWHSVLEKNLLDYLKLKLPQSYPDKILLTQVENL